MTNTSNPKLRLKKTSGWFPAGDGFLKAMTVLGDGPFKLFVFLCLIADRQTATCQSSHQRLAAGIGKSRHTVEVYVAELKAKGLCTVVTSPVPDVGSTIRIADEYWPFVTAGDDPGPDSSESYVDSVRKLFMALSCTSGRFGPAEERLAEDFEQKGIPLGVIDGFGNYNWPHCGTLFWPHLNVLILNIISSLLNFFACYLFAQALCAAGPERVLPGRRRKNGLAGDPLLNDLRTAPISASPFSLRFDGLLRPGPGELHDLRSEICVVTRGQRALLHFCNQ